MYIAIGNINKNIINFFYAFFLFTIFNAIMNFFDTTLPDIKKKGGELLQGILDGAKQAVDKAKTWVSNNIITPLVNLFKDIGDKFKKIGKDIIDGITKGIKDAYNTVKNAVTDVGDWISDTFCNIFGIRSPSKLFSEYGRYLDLGLAKGIEDNVDEVTDATGTLSDGVISAIRAANDLINDGLDDGITIKPVMDLSEIQNGTNRIYSMMNDIDGYSINGSANLAAEASATMKASKAIVNPISEKGAATSTTNNSTVNNNTFNITGNDPKEIAQEVSDILQKQVERMHVAWA